MKRKSPRPANDARPHAQPVGYVMLPRPYWTLRRLAVLGVLAIFMLLVVTASVVFVHRSVPAASALDDVTPTVAASPVVPAPATAPSPAAATVPTPGPGSAPPAPYDIVLDASQLDRLPPDAVNRLAADLPASVIESHPVHATPGALVVEISGSSRHAAHAPSASRQDARRDEAEFQAGVAATLLAEGRIDQALRAQHRASELAPHDMALRLGLAVMYDRDGDGAGAAMLYRQVLDAADRRDALLPPDTDIGAIRSRLAYLSAR